MAEICVFSSYFWKTAFWWTIDDLEQGVEERCSKYLALLERQHALIRQILQAVIAESEAVAGLRSELAEVDAAVQGPLWDDVEMIRGWLRFVDPARMDKVAAKVCWDDKLAQLQSTFDKQCYKAMQAAGKTLQDVVKADLVEALPTRRPCFAGPGDSISLRKRHQHA